MIPYHYKFYKNALSSLKFIDNFFDLWVIRGVYLLIIIKKPRLFKSGFQLTKDKV